MGLKTFARLFRDRHLGSIKVKRLPFEIIYEDRDVIVVDKPHGLLTTHTRAVGREARKGQMKSSRRVWLCHRLDRETSGLIMFAKSEAVAEYFRTSWNELTKKIYLAKVEGVIAEESGVFVSYLRDDSKTMKVSSVKDPRFGKKATTEWRVLSTAKNATTVEVTLKSGRKNQIRVHFSEAGHPVVGYEKYGAKKASRLCLHAHKLSFVHPHTKKTMDFVSPIDVESWR